MVEGSLWVYGRTRLADFYVGSLSLRELGNRLFALPPEAPIWDLLREEHEAAKAADRAAEVDDVLAAFKPKRG